MENNKIDYKYTKDSFNSKSNKKKKCMYCQNKKRVGVLIHKIKLSDSMISQYLNREKKFILTIIDNNNGMQTSLKLGIEYCPFCGRKL